MSNRRIIGGIVFVVASAGDWRSICGRYRLTKSTPPGWDLWRCLDSDHLVGHGVTLKDTIYKAGLADKA